MESPSLETKGRELGRLIGQSNEYQALKRANEELNRDEEAVRLLRRMEELRVTATRLIERGDSPTPEMESELDQLLSQVQVSAAYQRAIASQENFDKLMARVNTWIADGIRAGAASPIITLG